MKWEEAKKKLKGKYKIKEVDEDTIEFSAKGKLFRLHRFRIPTGFLVSETNRKLYDGRIMILHKIKNDWRLYHGY